MGTTGALLLAAAMLVAAMAVPAAAATFSNTSPITIPAGPGAGSLYPSPISVTGMGGTITDVNVGLNGMSHTWPDDVDILLVGPSGQTVVLMSDVGTALDITNVTLTLDDAVGSSLPDEAQITSGTYKPTQGVMCGTCGFNGGAPAPVGPYGATLSVFNGTAPNGTWNLYVYDDRAGDSGSISGGWTLDITTNAPTITSFTPTSGPPGTVVTITGTNLTGATSVTFGGVAGTITANTATQITATVPTGAVTGPIAVVTPAGTATSTTNFTVTILRHARNVSLNLPGSKARGTVTVPDGFTACAANVPVKVQHLVNGSWRTVASLTTTGTGLFRAGGVTDQGKYRAIAKKVTLASGDVCKKAKSPTVRQ